MKSKYLSTLLALILFSGPATAAAMRAAGVQGALKALRAQKRERLSRDEAREQERISRTAAIIRLQNHSDDYAIAGRIARAIEKLLRKRGFFVKDYRAVAAVIKKRGFSKFRSSRALRRLSSVIDAGQLVFVTIEKALVSTFRQEYENILTASESSVPDQEFIELQIKASVFDPGNSSVVFSRTDRQFRTYPASSQGRYKQQVFDEALTNCVDHLFLGYK